MQDAIEPSSAELVVERCPRCLLPVPPKVPNCPDCRYPIHPLRLLPFAIGGAGLLVLLFVLVVAFRVMRNDALLNAPVPYDSGAAQADPVHDPVSTDDATSPSKPSKPEKPPPLNEP